MNRMPDYLRVSLLSACNLQCAYCRPAGKKRCDISAPRDKVQSAIRFLYDRGIRKIRFTGGEPTLSKDLCGLVADIKAIDSTVHTAITSNGVLLRSLAPSLSGAGLDSANISIDTLNPDNFHRLTGKPYLKRVIEGIDAAVEYIPKVKLNCVLMRGVNDSEAESLIRFADERGLDMRFIEFMPNRYSTPGDRRYISGTEIRDRLPWDLKEIPGNPGNAARYYGNPSLKIKVGFISSVSHPFCSGCNRIRLTADGLLYTCLYDSRRIDLFKLIEDDISLAGSEYKRLVESKRFRGCHSEVDSDNILPSFSAIGG